MHNTWNACNKIHSVIEGEVRVTNSLFPYIYMNIEFYVFQRFMVLRFESSRYLLTIYLSVYIGT